MCIRDRYLVIGFASGIRGKLFWPVFWVLFCAYSLNRSNLKKMLLISVILLGALGLFQGGMTFIRSNKSCLLYTSMSMEILAILLLSRILQINMD